MKVLGFGASSSQKSINKRLVQHAMKRLRVLRPEVEAQVIDLNDYEMPIFSIDRELDGGVPSHARRFFEEIGGADGLIVSYAEHNGGYTAAFKNIFDWASRIDMKVFQEKPMLALSASVGPRGGANVLRGALESAPFFGADVVASLSVPSFRDTFDESRGLVDEALANKFADALGQFAGRLAKIDSTNRG
ncbi:MAG: NAD(P)H-dependent oxidoreductase [Myxococcota bacterium]